MDEETIREKKLIEFVAQQHGGQKRKYTGEPYVAHLISVASAVSLHGPLIRAVALCHDLLEDTSCSKLVLNHNLLKFGYDARTAAQIVAGVQELTDFFTPDVFPTLNRKERKAFEAERLGRISHLAASVKYADIADNVPSIVTNDKKFAAVYLKEKRQILNQMNQGDTDLRSVCDKMVTEAENLLQNSSL